MSIASEIDKSTSIASEIDKSTFLLVLGSCYILKMCRQIKDMGVWWSNQDGREYPPVCVRHTCSVLIAPADIFVCRLPFLSCRGHYFLFVVREEEKDGRV